MRNIEGLHTAISALISKHEDENRLAMDVANLIDEVKEEVDVHSATLDWYVNTVLRLAVENVLFKKGYKSVVYGKGLFVNPNKCNNPAYLARLFNNAMLSEQQKQKAVEMIKKAIKDSGLEGQLTMDFASNSLVEEITESQLLAMLKYDAVGDDAV